MEGGEDVRLSDDYFIEAQKDHPPEIKITRPGKDSKASPIEEVTVQVEAKDDFGLKSVELHYSVNGGAGEGRAAAADGRARPPTGTVDHLARRFQARARRHRQPLRHRQGRAHHHQHRHVLHRGAAVRDATTRSRSRPAAVAAVAATTQRAEPDFAAPEGNHRGHLESVQGHRAPRAPTPRTPRSSPACSPSCATRRKSLADRMKARQLTEAGDSFKSFVKDMEKAVEAMGPASDKLKAAEWQDALAPEQKALQYLLRAEATFRDIQVAFGISAGRRWWRRWRRRARPGRPVRPGTRYREEPVREQRIAVRRSAQQQQQQQIDEALQKLKQLARRQQELAEQQKKGQQQTSAAALAAGDAAPRSRAVAAPDGADARNGQQSQQLSRKSTGPAAAGPAGPARPTGSARPARPAGTTRSAGPVQGQAGQQQGSNRASRASSKGNKASSRDSRARPTGSSNRAPSSAPCSSNRTASAAPARSSCSRCSSA